MLKIIQIVAILQGVFLGVILIQKRRVYKHPIFELFMGCIISVVLFSIGDDDYNLLAEKSKWFFFHEPLIVTTFFLFIRYSNTEKETFAKRDFLFFTPYLIYLTFEILSNSLYFKESLTIKNATHFIELSFLSLLILSSYDIFHHQKNKWLLAFILPFTFIYAMDTLTSFLVGSEESFFYLDSYGIFLIAIFLFYFATYRLINSPKELLLTADTKYKLSRLPETQKAHIKRELIRLMTEEKIFKNQKLSAYEVADLLGITRQNLSEILNSHMGLRFQDLLNQYRVEEFIDCLNQEKYKNYTIIGIATEAGFSSKSSFNATFKKLKGQTPGQYKKQNAV